MAQSNATWSIRGRRELLSWDGSNSSCSTRPNSSMDRPVTPPAPQVLHAEGNCSWCGQGDIGDGGVRGHVETQESGPAKVFCSDICFSQCRRAAFKRAKVCDWCKHVRHTVTYVDLNDGQRQLQFCTDKCRNQYKMHLFCAEASSLGVQSCTTPGASSKNETPPGTSIDLKKQPGLLITPDLWLSDHQLDNSINVKLESNEQTELVSIDSDEERNCEAPLNLVHSSRRTGHSLKRKSNLVEMTEIPLSKKGKSYRKSHYSNSINTSPAVHRNVIPPATTWPSFPPHVVHPSYILQSHQFLALNRSVKPLKDALGDVPLTSTIESFDKAQSETLIQTAPIKSPLPDEAELVFKEKSKSAIEDPQTPAIPPNVVVLRIPFLIPLPIPVPIPIPLNIHEKYLKHVLT